MAQYSGFLGDSPGLLPCLFHVEFIIKTEVFNLHRKIICLFFLITISNVIFAVPNPFFNHYIRQVLHNKNNETLLDFSYFFPGTTKQEVMERYTDLKDESTFVYHGKQMVLSARTCSYPARDLMGYEEETNMPEVTQQYIFCDDVLIMQKNETKFDAFGEILYNWTSEDCNLVCVANTDEQVVLKSHNHSSVSSLLLAIPKEKKDMPIVEIIYDHFLFSRINHTYIELVNYMIKDADGEFRDKDFESFIDFLFSIYTDEEGLVATSVLKDWLLNTQLYSKNLPNFRIGDSFSDVKNKVEATNGITLEQDSRDKDLWMWNGPFYEEFYTFREGNLIMESYCFKDVSFSQTLLDFTDKYGGEIAQEGNSFIRYPVAMPDRMIVITHNMPEGWAVISFLPRE